MFEARCPALLPLRADAVALPRANSIGSWASRDVTRRSEITDEHSRRKWLNRDAAHYERFVTGRYAWAIYAHDRFRLTSANWRLSSVTKRRRAARPPNEPFIPGPLLLDWHFWMCSEVPMIVLQAHHFRDSDIVRCWMHLAQFGRET
jgi:hypothetical protein